MTVKHYINGSSVSEGRLIETTSPVDGQPLAKVHVAAKDVVHRAVDAARNAQHDWLDLPLEKRCEYVQQMAAWLSAQYGNVGELSEVKSLIMREVGKPLPEADIELIETSDFLASFATWALDLLSRKEIKLNEELWPTKRGFVTQEPYGVVAVIKPWNYPLELIGWSLGPALLAGNTVVIKPSERSPMTGSLWGRIADEVGLPPGVLNVVHGAAETGSCLVSSPGVDFVSFTGSVGAGRSVARLCAERLTKCSLELGGNDAAIVLEDCDQELASRGLTWGAFCNAGQVCVGIKRGFVQSSIYDEMIRRLVKNTLELRLGQDVGPLISESQREQVSDFVEDARQKGAKVLTGGNDVDFEGGYYYEPTILIDVPKDARVLREECFGPVLPILSFNSEAEAVEKANSSAFGLGASIWTSSSSKAQALAKNLSVGMVWMNDVNLAFAEAPWGGFRSSGLGLELSPQALLQYCRPKFLCLETEKESTREWWYPYGEDE